MNKQFMQIKKTFSSIKNFRHWIIIAPNPANATKWKNGLFIAMPNDSDKPRSW